MRPEHVHMIGIGGIGVSALARLYRSRGIQVSGSDLARSEITDALKKQGIEVKIGPHRSANLRLSVTRVIYSAAIKPENPEIKAAISRRIPHQTYSEAVGELTRQYRTIAVAGSHGKSTTTALIGLMLSKAGLDPTVIVGTKLREFGNSNFRRGRSPAGRRARSWLVIEADEYRASFLNYSPAVAVVTNIDREHLDFYKTVGRIEKAFLAFLMRITPNGRAVLNRDDRRLRRVAKRLRRARPDIRIVWYSLKDPLARKIREVIRIPGAHNVSNALAAARAAHLCRAGPVTILAAIHAYRGAWRRFQNMGTFYGARVMADYAHHPTEIKATLAATREKFPKSRIWCVFQPHHYERTRDLFHEFTAAFDACDGLLLLDIYEVAGRERSRRSPAINSLTLAQAISRRSTPAAYLANPRRLRKLFARWLKPPDILLMMGAGDIWEMTKELMRTKDKRQKTKASR